MKIESEKEEQQTLNLSAVMGENKFCGPSALAAICDITTDEAEAVIQNILGNNKPVKGLWPQDLRAAFKSLGYHCMTVNLPSGTTVYRAMFRLGDNPGMFVFEIPAHFITIEVTKNERFICDNHTKSALNLSNSARLNQRIILSAFKVVKDVKR